MKKPRIRKSVVLLLAAAVLLSLWTISWLDRDARPSLAETIETRGSRILGTRVDVADAEVDYAAGEVTVSGLVVANPGGFGDGNMITVAGIDARIDAADRVIDRITLSGVEVVFEFRGARNNFEELGERIDRRSREEDTEEGEPGAAPDASGQEADGEGWRVVYLEIGSARVTVRADWTSEVLEYDTDALTVENLDAGVEDLARGVTLRFLDQALAAAVEQAGGDRLREALEEELEELRSRAREAD